ncbi:MAG: hypothetical protein GWP10_21145 [Nitrospiraceae bacterium]|nr:hypothetical protein [Nitrospiraceae bacterium]
MTEHNTDIADIYDNPATHMTFAGVFGYVRVDLIPFRATIRRGQAWL